MITPSFSLTATERVLPKLALDFTTASLDARVTFTRTTDATHPATYTNSSGNVVSASNNQPRFDYDPITLTCKGLLIEESRTNSVLYSEAYSGSGWNRQLVTCLDNNTISPRGTQDAAKLTGTNGSTNYIYTNSITVSASTNYAISAYIKFGNSASAIFRVYTGNLSAQIAGVVIIWNAGVPSTSSVLGTWVTNPTYTNVGNGWYRVTGVFSSGANTTAAFLFYPDGPAVGGYSYLWGVQLEAGAFATSYIPTTTTALTRNADVATMTGTNFSDWYSAGAGSVVVRVLPSTVSGTRPVLQFDDATANEVITVRGSTTNPELVIVDDGSPQAQIDAGTIAANTTYNLGAAWNTNNCAAAVNGGAAVTDTSATIPTVTQARIGSDGTNYANAWLQKINYWPQRIINNETQAFSK